MYPYTGEQVDFSQYRDVNIITGAVKLFLRDLPIPIISFDAYSQIIKATGMCVCTVYVCLSVCVCVGGGGGGGGGLNPSCFSPGFISLYQT